MELWKSWRKIATTFHEQRAQAAAEALLIINSEKAVASSLEQYPAVIQQAVSSARQRLDAAAMDWRGAPIEARYACVAAIQQLVVTETHSDRENFSDKLDRVLTHKVWGTLIFIGIMALMFQSIFSFANVPMDALKFIVGKFGGFVEHALSPGALNSPLLGWVIPAVGAVVVVV